MSITMQEKILGALEAEIEVVGLDPVIQKTYSNTRHLYAQGPRFNTVLTIGFDIQSDYSRITISGDGLDALGLEDSPPEYRYENGRLTWYMLKHTDGDRIQRALELISAALRSTLTNSRSAS